MVYELDSMEEDSKSQTLSDRSEENVTTEHSEPSENSCSSTKDQFDGVVFIYYSGNQVSMLLLITLSPFQISITKKSFCSLKHVSPGFPLLLYKSF